MKRRIMYRLAQIILLGCVSFSATGQGTFQEVYQILQAKCTTCHNPGDLSGGLDLKGEGVTEQARMQSVYSKLVKVMPQNQTSAASGDQRVYPGRADRSFLFKKISGGFEPSVGLKPSEGEVMPPVSSGYTLDEVEKEMVRQWILFGAPLTGQVVQKDIIETYYREGGDESFPTGPPPAPSKAEGFQIKMGPFFLEPGGEIEYFQKWALDLPDDVDVNRIDFQIANYSHHFLLYYFENDGSQVPDGLRLNQNHSDIGLFAAIQEKIDLDLPKGTAFRWKKDVVLDLNSHYINYSFTQVYKAEVYLNIYTQPGGSAAQEMQSSLIPNISINIPNDGTPRTFQQPIFTGGGEIFVWGLMGHTHKYGKDYKVYLRNANGTKGEMIYDASCPEGIPGCVSPYFDYQHIPMRYYSPLYPLKMFPGIIHEATYLNDGPAPVRWGPTSDDEMMIMIMMFTRDTSGVISHTGSWGKSGSELRSWPNPVSSDWHIEIPPGMGECNYSIYSTGGTRVLSGAVEEGLDVLDLDLSGLLPGLYFYRLIGKDGGHFTGKLVKE